MKVIVTKDNVHIEDSFLFSKKHFDQVLDVIQADHPDSLVWVTRSRFSLKMEWATHNCLYDLGLWKSHTKDVDLDAGSKIALIYDVVGLLVWPFIR